MIRLLTFTTLYPNRKQPTHGIFVENRISHLIASGKATTTVIAPVPYVPNLAVLPEAYRSYVGVPRTEERQGIRLHHPRYVLLPKISMLAAPLSLYVAAKHCLSALVKSGCGFELIDAHYFYPDGIAAILLGRHFDRPVTITARGSDVNIIAKLPLPRKLILWAAAEATAVITVSQDLKDTLTSFGVSAEKIRVLRNGVDLKTFTPTDRTAARARIGIDGTTLLSIGNLVPLKGHDLAIKAIARLTDTRLLIVGDGPEERKLRKLAQDLGVSDRVRFLGRRPQQALPDFYAAADALVLLSSSEGWPNVLLEAMACGTPVLATRVGGTPEIVTSDAVGELVSEREPIAIAEAMSRLLARKLGRLAIRAYAERFSWDVTTDGQLELFSDILTARRPQVSVHASVAR